MANSVADDYTCHICLDVLLNPVEVPCGHAFCEDCLNASSLKSTNCPVCRRHYTTSCIEPAKGVRRAMSLKYQACPHCLVPFRIDGLRCHVELCKTRNHAPPVPVSSHAASRSAAACGTTGSLSMRHSAQQRRAPPNRDTFMCPLCTQGPMDCIQLANHAGQQHKGDKRKVVCPICAAMPWGEPDKQSDNFVDHATLRHRFEYDRFVDFTVDEDEALQEALQISTGCQ